MEGRVVGARDAAKVRIEARGEAMVVVESRGTPTVERCDQVSGRLLGKGSAFTG